MGRAPHPDRYRTAHTQAGLWLGVFLLFAPIGFLLALCPSEPWALGAGVAVAVFSGSLSIGWMYTFRERRFWMIAPLIALPIFAGPLIFLPLARFGVMHIGASMGFPERRIALAVAAVACLALGFTLVIRHVRRTDEASWRWKAELDLGQKIHQRLVTPVSVRMPGIEIVGRSDASAEMGGDLLDVVRRDGCIDLLVGDVAGHGVAAGVLMALVKGAVRIRLQSDVPGTPSELLRDLSRIVEESGASGMFVTMACVRVCDGGNSVEVSLAGHDPILWWRAAEGRLERIENESMPLGVSIDETYPTRSIAPAPGDWVVVYTDGLVEVPAGAPTQLNLTGFSAIVESEIRSAESAQGFIDRVVARVRDHGPVTDDQTISVIRFLA